MTYDSVRAEGIILQLDIVQVHYIGNSRKACIVQVKHASLQGSFKTLFDQVNKALYKTKKIVLSISYISRAFTYAINAIHEEQRSKKDMKSFKAKDSSEVPLKKQIKHFEDSLISNRTLILCPDPTLSWLPCLSSSYAARTLLHAPYVANAILNMSKSTIMQWRYSKVSNSDMVNSGSAAVMPWSCPSLGRVKCNVDASIDPRNKRTDFGFIIRDHEGNFLARGAGSRVGLQQPKVAEALGIHRALSWLKRKNFHDVSIEMDSQIFFHAFNNVDLDMSVFGLVLDDCCAIANTIESCKVDFICRSANGVAHSIARATLSLSGFEDWELVPPQFISDVIAPA